jgi:hypothetical protein
MSTNSSLRHPIPAGTIVSYTSYPKEIERTTRLGVVIDHVFGSTEWLYFIEPAIYEPWHRDPTPPYRVHSNVSVAKI